MVQMPALNTPQFGWVKSRLPRHPQPVPPIYQPEVAADAITYAARTKRREIWVGMPTLVAVLANRVAPNLLDHYLARTNIQAQQYGGHVSPDRPNNLWEPLPGDHGAHGVFDHRSRRFSWQLWVDKRRKWFALGGLVALAIGLGYATTRTNRDE
jgi:hypothetical protein